MKIIQETIKSITYRCRPDIKKGLCAVDTGYFAHDFEQNFPRLMIKDGKHYILGKIRFKNGPFLHGIADYLGNDNDFSQISCTGIIPVGDLKRIKTTTKTYYYSKADIVTNLERDRLFIVPTKETNISACSLKKNPVINLSHANFNKLVGSSGIKIVDWHAENWCPHCVEASKFFKKLNKKYPKITIIKIDCDKNLELASLHKVEVLPTVDIYKNGKKIKRIEGTKFKQIEVLLQKIANKQNPSSSEQCAAVAPKQGEVVVIIGSRGSGKTATMFSMMEDYHKRTQRKCYILGIPEKHQSLLPKYIHIISDLAELPEHCCLGVDESGIEFVASSKKDSLLNYLMELARHMDVVLIFANINTTNIQVDIVRNIDTILIKMPSLLQCETERPAIRKLTVKALEKFKQLSEKERLRHAYKVSHNCSGMVTNELPSFWSKNLSTSWADSSESPKKDSQH